MVSGCLQDLLSKFLALQLVVIPRHHPCANVTGIVDFGQIFIDFRNHISGTVDAHWDSPHQLSFVYVSEINIRSG